MHANAVGRVGSVSSLASTSATMNMLPPGAPLPGFKSALPPIERVRYSSLCLISSICV